MIRRTLVRLWNQGVRVVAPWRSHQRRQERWERGWADPELLPSWTEYDRSARLAQALEWFPAGGRVLDVGCGTGALSLAFAEHGFEVLGVDYSESAIARARARVPAKTPRIEFRVFDLCRDRFTAERFDAILDSSCFFSIVPHLVGAYGECLAGATDENARFLLVAPCYPSGRDRRPEDAVAEMLEKAKHAFGRWFQVLDIDHTALPARGDGARAPLARVTIRMLRLPHAARG